MDGVGIAAIVTSMSVLLGAIGAGIKYMFQLVLDAYKQQVESTEAAKNAEIEAKDAQISRHQAEISYLRDQVLSRLDGQK